MRRHPLYQTYVGRVQQKPRRRWSHFAPRSPETHRVPLSHDTLNGAGAPLVPSPYPTASEVVSTATRISAVTQEEFWSVVPSSSWG